MVNKHITVLQQSIYNNCKMHCYKIPIKHKCILQKYRTTDKTECTQKIYRI